MRALSLLMGTLIGLIIGAVLILTKLHVLGAGAQPPFDGALGWAVGMGSIVLGLICLFFLYRLDDPDPT